MKQDWERFFVLTGGPGAGKTTLIQALAKSGYATTVESARVIIQDQVAIGGRALPWLNRALFAELMLSWDMRSYRMAQETTGPVFFDRGLIDVLGYLRLIGAAIPGYMEAAAKKFRYNPCVFAAPPWREIFHQDQERKQHFEEALKTYEVMSIYKEFGYELIEVPRAPVEDRVRFVLKATGICK